MRLSLFTKNGVFGNNDFLRVKVASGSFTALLLASDYLRFDFLMGRFRATSFVFFRRETVPVAVKSLIT